MTEKSDLWRVNLAQGANEVLLGVSVKSTLNIFFGGNIVFHLHGESRESKSGIQLPPCRCFCPRTAAIHRENPAHLVVHRRVLVCVHSVH